MRFEVTSTVDDSHEQIKLEGILSVKEFKKFENYSNECLSFLSVNIPIELLYFSIRIWVHNEHTLDNILSKRNRVLLSNSAGTSYLNSKQKLYSSVI